MKANKTILTVALLAGLLGAETQLNRYLRLNAPVRIDQPPELMMNRKTADPRFFRLLSLGHLPVTIDWLWLVCLMDQAVTRVPPGFHPPLYYNFELLTKLDEAFFTAYYAGASLLSVIRRDGPGALLLLERAEKFRTERLPAYSEEFRRNYWPNEWKIPLLSAYVQLFELDDLPAAAESFIRAAKIPGSPQYLDHLAERLSAPNGRYEVGIRLLQFLIETAPNEASRVELGDKLKKLRLSLKLVELNERFEQNLRKRKEAPGSYFPRFLAEQGIPPLDELGGTLYINEAGKIDSTTPREAVFGLSN